MLLTVTVDIVHFRFWDIGDEFLCMRHRKSTHTDILRIVAGQFVEFSIQMTNPEADMSALAGFMMRIHRCSLMKHLLMIALLCSGFEVSTCFATALSVKWILKDFVISFSSRRHHKASIYLGTLGCVASFHNNGIE